jgi:hypothetical protein
VVFVLFLALLLFKPSGSSASPAPTATSRLPPPDRLVHRRRPPRGGLALASSFVKKPYVLHMGVVLFLAVIMGQAWNVVGGYAGQYSVGHAAYFGGAYTT